MRERIEVTEKRRQIYSKTFLVFYLKMSTTRNRKFLEDGKISIKNRGAAIAQWIRLRLPTCLPIVTFVLFLSSEKNEKRQKETGFGTF